MVPYPAGQALAVAPPRVPCWRLQPPGEKEGGGGSRLLLPLLRHRCHHRPRVPVAGPWSSPVPKAASVYCGISCCSRCCFGPRYRRRAPHRTPAARGAGLYAAIALVRPLLPQNSSRPQFLTITAVSVVAAPPAPAPAAAVVLGYPAPARAATAAAPPTRCQTPKPGAPDPLPGRRLRCPKACCSWPQSPPPPPPSPPLHLPIAPSGFVYGSSSDCCPWTRPGPGTRRSPLVLLPQRPAGCQTRPRPKLERQQ